MRSTLTRVLAGTAIAATAVLTAAGTASATTPPKAPTSLSVVAAKSTITNGQLDFVSGVLKSGTTPLAHKVVILDRFYNKAWHPVVAKLTGPKGAVTFAVRPHATSAYKLIFKGNAAYRPAHSGIVVIKVKPFVKIPTMLSAAESAASIKAGQTNTVSGVLTARSKALPRQWVWLAKVVSGKPVLIKAFLTNSAGKVAFKVAPHVTTVYELVFRGTPVFAKSVSGTVTTTVS